MKFTSLPKKLLLTGMSAAMVVAFAPAVALANVSDAGDSTSTTTTTQAGVIATLQYSVKKDNTTTNYTQDFKSDATTTNDDALQAAVDAAAVLDRTDVVKGSVKVTLNESVVADGIQDTSGLYYYAKNVDEGIVLTGSDYTLDLNGKTITNSTGMRAVTVGNAKLTRSGGTQTVTEEVYAHPGSLSASANQAYRQKDNTKVTGKTLTAVEASGDSSYYQYNEGGKKWDAVTDAGFIKDNADKVYQKYEVTYENTVTNDEKSKDAGTITISGATGTIESVNDQSAVKVNKGTLIVDGATVKSTKAASAIENRGALQLKDGATVDASFDEQADNNGDKTIDASDTLAGYAKSIDDTVYAIKGAGNVTIGDKVSSTASGATVKSELKNGTGTAQAKHYAYGIQGDEVTVNDAAIVTATATGSSATAGTAGESGLSNQDSSTTVIIGPKSGQGTAAGSVGSVAVSATNATIHYGTYTADDALVAGTGSTVYAGQFDGHVGNVTTKAAVTLRGGKYLYEPDPENLEKGYEGLEQGNVLYDGTDSVQGDDSYYYVYRLGKVVTLKVGSNTEGMMDVAAPADAKDAKGKAYKNLTDYVNDQYLAGVTSAEVKAQQTNRAKELVDGNKADTLDVQLTERYVVPSETDAELAGLSTEYAQIAKDAESNGEAVQGIYQLSAQTYYGHTKDTYKKSGSGYVDASGVDVVKSDGNYNLIDNAAATDLSGLGIGVTAHRVQTNANAAVYSFDSAGATTAVDSTTSAAIGAVAAGDTNFTAPVGNYVVKFTKGKTAAQTNAEAAQPVIDAIAALATDYPEITADNVDAAQAAANAAAGAYTGLTADQKALVTNYADLTAFQSKISAYRTQAAADAQKAAEDAQKEADQKAEDAQKAAADSQTKADQAAVDAAQAKADAAEQKQAAEAAQKAADEAKAQLAALKAQNKAKAKTVKGLKVKAGKKKATVSWKKASGYKYQLKYRQKNSSKTADFKYAKTSKTKYVAKNLKTGKYYNFKVRTYKKVSGKTVYGKWTSIVTGKIK